MSMNVKSRNHRALTKAVYCGHVLFLISCSQIEFTGQFLRAIKQIESRTLD